MERIAVVDEDDRFVRWEPRNVIHQQRLYHRSVHIALFDAEGRLLVQRRHYSKDTYPGCWDVSCTGHVDAGDYPGGLDATKAAAYEAAAVRELEEELGIRADLHRVAHFAPLAGMHYEQIELFVAESSGPFVPEASEIEELQHVTVAEYQSFRCRGEPLTRTLVFIADWLIASGRWRA